MGKDEIIIGDGGGKGITLSFLEECLNKNQLGDALLFISLNYRKFLYEVNSGKWYVFNGHTWERDEFNQALSAVETLAQYYLKAADKCLADLKREDIDKKEASRIKKLLSRFLDRAFKLRGETRRKQVLEMAHTTEYPGITHPMSIKSEDFDQHPMLLACKNGVIDLDQESFEFRPGTPEDFITMASPVEWKGLDAPCPIWEETLLTIFDGNQEIVDYLRRVVGYAITGLTIEDIFVILHGKGRNGKGVIKDTLIEIFSPLAGPIQSELLLSGRSVRNSSGPSPDIMRFKGMRIAFASETDEGKKFSTAQVKLLTGSDRLTARNPHDKYYVEFNQTHTLFLLTNELPHVSHNDYAFWERAHLVKFPLSFVDRKIIDDDERPRDKYLKNKLKVEYSGILAWCVRGCLEWQEKDGLQPPKPILEATAEYRKSEDVIAKFVDDCCDLGEYAKIQASVLYDSFREWYQKNVSKYAPSGTKFGKMMTETKFKRDKVSGRNYYFGLCLKDDLFAENGEDE